MNKSFFIVGEDKRMVFCKKYLGIFGYKIADNLQSADVVILPVRAKMNDFNFSNNQIIFGYNDGDYSYCNDEFIFRNSRQTAQGVLAIILNNISVDISDENILVLGYGNCGKAICDMLKNLSANVFCYARRKEILEEISQNGIYPVEKVNFAPNIIINTVPSNILHNDYLSSLSDSTIYIETASAPYGFDITLKDNYKFKFISANGLPGKFTPISAGENIARSVIEKLREENYE